MPEDAVRPVGRPKQWSERLLLTLAEGATGQIDAALDADEDRLAFIRAAIAAEHDKRAQQRREPTMDPATRAHMIAMAVNNDLQLATAAYEIFKPSGQDEALVEVINASGINPAFNVISEVLHKSAVMALCRIWDDGSQTTLLTLKNLIKQIEHPNVFAVYSAPDRRTVDRQRLEALKVDVEAARESGEIEALLDLRNRHLAHTAATHPKAKAKVVLYGDERRALELTLPLATRAAAMVQCTLIAPETLRSRWERESAKLWSRLVASLESS